MWLEYHFVTCVGYFVSWIVFVTYFVYRVTKYHLCDLNTILWHVLDILRPKVVFCELISIICDLFHEFVTWFRLFVNVFHNPRENDIMFARLLQVLLVDTMYDLLYTKFIFKFVFFTATITKNKSQLTYMFVTVICFCMCFVKVRCQTLWFVQDWRYLIMSSKWFVRKIIISTIQSVITNIVMKFNAFSERDPRR